MSDTVVADKVALHPLSSVKRVFAVVGGKGGVGKSTVSALLAVEFMRRGLRVGILDADVTGPSIPKLFGITDAPGGSSDGVYPAETKFGIQVISMNLLLDSPSDPVVWRGAVCAEYVKSFYARVIWTELDVLLIDMPPGTGDIPLTVLSSLPIDGVIAVFTPQKLASDVLDKALNMSNRLGVKLVGAVNNQAYFVCDGCGTKLYPYGKTDRTAFTEKYGALPFAEIPIDEEFSRLADRGLIELVENDSLEGFCNELEKYL